MHWAGWTVTALVAVTGGWMLFDGLHALVTGDFVTPGSGAHAGRLGPWAGLLSGIGPDSRSLLVKCVFVGYAVAYPGSGAAFAAGAEGHGGRWPPWPCSGCGTSRSGRVANVAVPALVLVPSLRIRG